MREILVFFAVSLACMAQYVSTDDGSRLFFTSSDRMTGTNQSFRSKLFSWDTEHGVQLVYESPAEDICCISITGDGSLAAFVGRTADSPQTRGELLDLRTGQVEIVGTMAVVSRNGRYLFTGDALVEPTAGTSRPLSIAPAFVGTDGSLLYRDRDSLHRIDPDGTDRTVISGFRFGQLIAADENTTTAIVFPEPGSPVVLDMLTGRQVDLSTAGASTGAPAFLSRDGQWVTFEAQLPPDYYAQVMLCRSDASGCKTLTNPPVLASPIALSGDAASVYAIYQNRVLRIDTKTGRTEQGFVFASFSPQTDAPIVPGSLVRFSALNAGDHITVNGMEAPLLSSPDGLPVIQVPWDLAGQSVQFRMYGGDSPFETVTRTYPVSDFYPQGFGPGSPVENAAYRQDWSATTYESPAAPGEIVHIYAVGLGAVDCPVETGQPAPLDRLCRTTRMVDWQWITAPNTTVPAEVLFAGLAPGMVGLYQIDVRVPAYKGYQFIELSDGVRNPRVAFVRVQPR